MGVHLWGGFPAPGCLFANLVDTTGQFHGLSTPSGAVQANVFQHVGLSYDKATGLGRLFLNGVVVDEQNLGQFTPETTFDLYIGQRPPGGASSRTFRGIIDEVSLYKRALSSNEIVSIYTAGDAGKCRELERPSLSISNISANAVRVGMQLVVGGTYQVESSVDLSAWTPEGAPFDAMLLEIYRDFDISSGSKFFRLVRLR